VAGWELEKERGAGDEDGDILFSGAGKKKKGANVVRTSRLTRARAGRKKRTGAMVM
jgi:hypothetical protein